MKIQNTNTNNNNNEFPSKSNVFPCKSIGLVRFLKANGILSEHKYTDDKDKKDCWIFLRTEQLGELLNQWGIMKQQQQNGK